MAYVVLLEYCVFIIHFYCGYYILNDLNLEDQLETPISLIANQRKVENIHLFVKVKHCRIFNDGMRFQSDKY